MTFFWLLLTILLITAFVIAMSRRKRYESVEDEPWRASLREDGEELDMEAAREAEEEWLREEWNGDEPDDAWRG